MKKELTNKEAEFWDKYVGYCLAHLVEPTREELSAYLKMSPQLIQYYISVLRKKDWIKQKGEVVDSFEKREIKNELQKDA